MNQEDEIQSTTIDSDGKTLSDNHDDDIQSYHASDSSSIIYFTHNHSITTESDMPITSLSMIAISSQQSLNQTKSKYGLRNLIKKFFCTSPKSVCKRKTTTGYESLNIDLTNKTAYQSISPLPVTQGPIRLFILRHGERLDRYYATQWLRQAFDKDGNYCRFSPILPESFPSRASIFDYDLDPPLTYQGLKDAYHTGAALKEKNLLLHYFYTSPSLRCIQTATKILEGLQLHHKHKLRIEPGLFECTGWYTTNDILTMPKFMTKKELIENKYPIDKSYNEQMNLDDISQYETELEYYQRSHAVTAAILKMHENEFITQIQQGQMSIQNPIHILFVGHAPTLETCTRKLCGGNFRPTTLGYVIRNVDYLTMTVIEKTNNNSDKWTFRRKSLYGEEF